MANCSFISAGEARNLARNSTLLWTEICEVQTQILAAIDGDPCATPPVPGAYSVLVNGGTPMTSTSSVLSAVPTTGGTGYNLVSATAVINAAGTAGINATVTPFIPQDGTTITRVDINDAGTGYDPVNATATVGQPSELVDSHDETNYDGSAGNGTFAGGSFYRGGDLDTITLSEGHTALVNTIGTATGVVLTALQNETNFAASFNGGTNYTAGNTIVLSDGSVITIDLAPAGVITEFTVTTASTAQFTTLATLVQASSTSTGTGFSVTSQGGNEIPVGPVATFTLNAPGSSDPFFYPTTIIQSSVAPLLDAIGTGFTLTPNTNNITVSPPGIGAVLTPIVTNGAITDVIINAPGSGYLFGAPILFPTPPGGAGATAIVNAVGVGGTITSIAVTIPGTGYDQAVATITVTAPGGLTPAVEFVGTVTTSTAVSSNDYTNGLALVTGANTITRTDGTPFNGVGGDGFAVGQKITLANAEDSENDGIYTISAVTALIITTTEAITTSNADDDTITINHTAVVAGITITEGGVGYADLKPTAVVTDPTGTGATLTTEIAGGAVTAFNVVTGGAGYTSPTITITAAPTSSGNGATSLFSAGDIVIGTNTFGTDTSEYNDVLTGQSSDAVISDQIQYVLDYFTALGYNIRAQTNPATADTIQWQIIW